MSEYIRLKEWAEKNNPPSIFTAQMTDIREWAGLPVTFTVESMWAYLLHKFGSIAITDYNSESLNMLTAIWHSANYYKFTGLSETTKQTYNPIENYNRVETETTERTPDITRTENKTDTPRVSETHTVTETPRTTETETHNLSTAEGGTTERETETDNTQSAGATGKVSPMDAGGLFNNATSSETSATVSEDVSETVTHGRTLSDTGTVTRAKTGTDTREDVLTKTGSDTSSATSTETGTDTTERETHISGNIGVTTTQEMLEQERKIVNFVFLDEYISAWINAFCIGIWL